MIACYFYYDYYDRCYSLRGVIMIACDCDGNHYYYHYLLLFSEGEEDDCFRL